MRTRRATHRRFTHTTVAALAAALLLLAPGCFTVQHTVGTGPMTGETISASQWYAVWGLVPLDAVDSGDMAGADATDYRVTAEFTFGDVILSAITSFFGFYRQTITVEK